MGGVERVLKSPNKPKKKKRKKKTPITCHRKQFSQERGKRYLLFGLRLCGSLLRKVFSLILKFCQLCCASMSTPLDYEWRMVA